MKALAMVKLLHGYDEDFKAEWKSESMKMMKGFKKEIEKQIGRSLDGKVAFNPAGIACAGDPSLMVMLSESIGIHMFTSDILLQLCYRSIRTMKDYSGGPNCWIEPREIVRDGIPAFCNSMIRQVGAAYLIKNEPAERRRCAITGVLF